MFFMTFTLSQLRKEIKPEVSQLQIAARAGVSLNSVVNAENLNRSMHYSTLIKILKAINAYREENNLSQIDVKDMQWNIR